MLFQNGRENVVGTPGTKIADGWELPSMCWELYWYPLKEHPVILVTEPSLLMGLNFLLRIFLRFIYFTFHI